MADYIYLLQTRLTNAQRNALEKVHEIAKAHSMTMFLVGGAVRDLTCGAPIRDLDVALQGSALSLRKELESVGGIVLGESRSMDAVYLNFPGGVRLEVGSTLSITYPKPGKPAVEHASILDDLRRRDFTANAMAISLNEGSYGLLMDPLNGIADIENMELRLVSNYGFIEDPVRMIRAARLGARLGWHLEEKTQQRYETGKSEGYISAMSSWQQGYETEEIFHEEDPLFILRRLEAEGWNKHLFPAWTSAKINENELNKIREIVGQLDAVGIHPDASPAYYPILTAKLSPGDAAALAKSFPRSGFVNQANALEGETKAFAAQFTSKAAAAPSEAWKMLMAAPPEQVLWLAYSSKNASVQARFKAFFTEWPQARQRIPYQLMQEMRINPDLPGYAELIETLFFAIMDGKLDTTEAAKAYLEPFSPPAPPPPPNLRRRPAKRETKASKRKKDKVEKVDLDSDDVQEPIAASAEPENEVALKAKEVSEKVQSVRPAAEKAKPSAKKAEAVEVAKSAALKTEPAKTASKKAALPVKPAAGKPLPLKKAVAVKAAATSKTAPVKKAVVKMAKPSPARAGAKHGKPAAKVAKKTVVAKKAAKAPQKAANQKSAAKAVSGKQKTSAKAEAKKSQPAKKPLLAKAPSKSVAKKTTAKKTAAKAKGRR